MATEWYYQVMGETLGPLSAAQMREKALSGEIAADTRVRKGTQGDWVAADHVKGLITQSSVSSPPKPPRFDIDVPVDHLSRFEAAKQKGSESKLSNLPAESDTDGMKSTVSLSGGATGQTKMTSLQKRILGYLVAFPVIVIVALAIIGPSKRSGSWYEHFAEESNTQKPVEQKSVPVGEEGILETPTGRPVIVGNTEEDYSRFLKLQVANDKIGITQMEDAGRIALIPRRTPVLVLDSTWLGVREVRILEGLYKGKSVWTASEFIKAP